MSSANVAGLRRATPIIAENGGPAMAAHTQTSWRIQDEVHEEDSWDWSMAEDEILQR